MTDKAILELTEDDLDERVSAAIVRAEQLEDVGSPDAVEAWREVLLYETRLAELTGAGSIEGGVARAGAVHAAMLCGERKTGESLAERYLADRSLSEERRRTVRRLTDPTYDRHAIVTR